MYVDRLPRGTHALRRSGNRHLPLSDVRRPVPVSLPPGIFVEAMEESLRMRLRRCLRFIARDQADAAAKLNVGPEPVEKRRNAISDA